MAEKKGRRKGVAGLRFREAGQALLFALLAVVSEAQVTGLPTIADGSHRLEISLPMTTNVAGRQELPAGTAIHVSGVGVWTLDGGTLNLHGATIDAPEDKRIFAGTGHVTGLSVARPEWFADAVNGVYPESALRAAYAALQPGGTILLREASYVSPFIDPHGPNPCGGNAVRISPSLTLVGVKRPEPDSESAPTRLLGGTILRGGICADAALHASRLGVDVGDYVTEHDFGGARAFGVQLGNGGKLGSIAGTSLDDVSVLAMGFRNQHSIIIDGQRDAVVHDLWVWTPGGDHGLIMKSLSSTISGLHCRGASFDCLILKSDYVTDREGDASGSTVDGVFIRSMKTPGDTGGIVLEGRWDNLRHVVLRNIHEEGLKVGIIGDDFGVYQLSDVRIENWTATGMTGPCLVLNGSLRFSVDGFRCSVSRMKGGAAFVLGGRETTLRHGTLECADSQGCSRAGGDGIVDAGRSNRVESVKGTGFGGFLVRTSPHRGGTALEGLDASAMGGRAASVYAEPTLPLGERIGSWWTDTKPYFRIFWTRIYTAAGSNGTIASLAGIVFLSLLLLVFLRRRSSRRVP